MTEEREIRQLLRQLGTAPAAVDDAERASKRRSRVVARLEELQREEGQRRAERGSWRRQVALVAMVATPILVIGGWWMLARQATPSGQAGTARVGAIVGSVLVSRAGEPERAAPSAGMSVEPAEQVRTGADGQARISLASGAIVDLAQSTRVRLSPFADGHARHHEQVELMAGRIVLDVPKLASDRSLAVRTGDARVVVHGTRFVVEIRGAASSSSTQVQVEHGVVVVHAKGQEARLVAGERWSSADHTVAATADGTEAIHLGGEADPADEQLAAADRADAVAGRAPAKAAQSTLAAENRLYARALAARERGDDRAVVAILDELLRRYPGSTLAPAARLERSRAAERLQGAGTPER